MLAVLTRNGDFRRLFFAQLITFGADWFLMVPLLVLLAKLTGGGLWGGLVLAIDTGVLALLMPYAGAIADRVDRKKIMIFGNLAAVVAVSSLFLVRGSAAGPIAVVAVGAIAVAKAFFTPAASSALPNLVKPEELSGAMAVAGSAWGTMTVVGSSLGGVLTSIFSPYACFAVIAVSLLGSAALTWGIRQPTQAFSGAPVTGRGSAWSAVREGLAYVKARPRLLSLVTVKSAVGVGNGLLVVFPLFVLSFGYDAEAVALLFLARGLGALVGPFLMRVVLKRPEWLLSGLSISMASYGLAYLGVAVAHWFPLALVLVFVAHVAGGGNWMMSAYAIQRIVPDELRGRVGATDFMVAMIAVTSSQLVVSLLVDSIDPRAIIAGCALTTLTYAVGWRLVTRRVERNTPLPQPS
ncbi:MFS family permease [Allocatelliglobosispora scoriae]|uniref:MFS family permease n=1 Tax=Allocatelliglobosispora scoriae TaxID=643052 RepID=A0A841BWZ4_9ACTN|nr:MFS transporter [Allocatelliglobosispora scoriae]MBB5872018.1 MFS family permease [Allocatelliglobosispora scoriae]